MKIISYNVNGIRAACNKGFMEWLAHTDADIVCLQEIKALPEQINVVGLQSMGYHVYLHSAMKKGYSGVAILSKHKPKHVKIGCDEKAYDDEGRVIRADFDNFSVISVYMPSGSSGEERQRFKYKWLEFFYDYAQELASKLGQIVICGDYNICHQPIDIHNPVGNKNSSGFLPEERAWMSKHIESGFVDTFRMLNPEPHHYTWWSYRSKAREKNLGWRIDYYIVSKEMKSKVGRSVILKEAKHSDHCPIMLELNIS